MEEPSLTINKTESIGEKIRSDILLRDSVPLSSNSINCIAEFGEGQVLVATYKEIILYDINERRILRREKAHDSNISFLLVVDKALFFSGGFDCYVIPWIVSFDWWAGKSLRLEGWIMSIFKSPILATVGVVAASKDSRSECSLSLWNYTTQEEIFRFPFLITNVYTQVEEDACIFVVGVNNHVYFLDLKKLIFQDLSLALGLWNRGAFITVNAVKVKENNYKLVLGSINREVLYISQNEGSLQLLGDKISNYQINEIRILSSSSKRLLEEMKYIVRSGNMLLLTNTTSENHQSNNSLESGDRLCSKVCVLRMKRQDSNIENKEPKEFEKTLFLIGDVKGRLHIFELNTLQLSLASIILKVLKDWRFNQNIAVDVLSKLL